MKLYLVAMLFLILLIGCSVNSSEEQGIHPILLGESIDGVKIGDNENAVIDKLGQPDEIFLGDFGGSVYGYKKGKHAGLMVSILSEQGKGVVDVSISKPYSGQTTNGIGVGSSREYVLKKLGNPSFSGEGAAKGSTIDFYYYEKNKFSFCYPYDVVELIVMSTK